MPATFESLLDGKKKLFRHTDGVTSVTPFSIMKCHSETGLTPAVRRDRLLLKERVPYREKW